MASLRARRGLARVAPAAEHLRDVGRADTQSLSDLADSVPGVAQRKHPLAQVLRIRFATPPLHPASPAKTSPESFEAQLSTNRKPFLVLNRF